MKIGRKIFFDATTGDIITDTGERQGNVTQTSVEQDVSTYTALSERNRTTFDVLELAYGDYAQDFAECSGYRVNTTTKTLEFSYPDPNAPTAEPVYQAPLTEQVTTIKAQAEQTSVDLQGFMDYYFSTTP